MIRINGLLGFEDSPSISSYSCMREWPRGARNC